MTYVNLYEAVRTIVRTLPGGNALALGRLYSLADNPLFQSAVQCLAQAIQSSGVEVRVVADGKRRPIADHERSYRFDFWRGTLTDPFVASSQPPLRDLLICVEDLKREIADLIDPPRLGSTALKQRAIDEQIARYTIARLDDMGPEEASRVIAKRVESEHPRLTVSSAMIRGRIASAKRSAKRRALMEAWAAYCEPSTADDKVTPLRRKA